MTIYRGPGGTGEARTDSDITEVRIIADEAEGYKNDAAASASAAASSASAAATAETNAETAEANAETAEANAEAAQAAAEAAQAAAEAAQTAAEAAQTAAELAETNAETAEANAETAEANAETAQAAAATSATNAAASASTATTQASNAASSASTATTQAGIATTKASEAASSATAAQSAQTAAESARDSALSAYDNFDDRYLGPKSSDPTLDNDGNALLTGALYYDTTSSVMKVYTGSSWVAAYVSAAGVLLAANNLSDLVSVATARTNLGLGTAATTASTAYATAAQGTNADTAYGWGNHASAGYAADSAVVKLTGDQTVGGTKTFSSTITGSVSGNAATATTATNLSGGTVSATSISDSGNLTFTGTGNRITGDFSNATFANRVAFQTSTSNSATTVYAIPNGTSTTSGFIASTDPSVANGSEVRVIVNGTTATLTSSARGSGTTLPMTFDVGGERMRVDTSGNLGIGTSSPATKLNVIGDIQLSRSATASDAAINFGSNSNNYIYSGNANNLMAFATNGAERARITSSGDVGIGTSSPNKSSSSTALTVNTGTAANYSAVEWSSGNTLNYHINANDSAIYHVAAGTRPWIVYTNGSERMRIDTGGNVGIGTSSTSGARLAVRSGTATNHTILGNDYGSLYLETASGGPNRITSLNSALNSGQALAFNGSGGAEWGRFDSSGRLLVGTTTGIANGTFCVKSNYSGAEACSFQGGSNGYIVTFHNTSGTLIGSITGSTGSTTAYNTSSDYRLKENIAPMTGALATVAQLKPCTYTWKVDGSAGQGFIAHELQEVVPDCVSGEKDAVNEDGSIKPQGIDTSFLVATLTAAIQEQQAIITALTARVAALESN